MQGRTPLIRNGSALVAALALALLTLAPLAFAQASVVDATQAEAAFQKALKIRIKDDKDVQGREELKTTLASARSEFEKAIGVFRTASKDSSDFLTYREAAYLYDRLADCCFSQRDWGAMKTYLDGLLVVGISERNLCETQLQGALASGISLATAGYLNRKLDQSVRYNQLIQVKRSLGLMLLDSGGAGERGERAIVLYQQLGLALRKVAAVEDGAYSLDTAAIEQNFSAFEKVIDALEELGGIDELWQKYPPVSQQAGAQPAA